MSNKGKIQHVVKHPNGWAVKGEGNSKATKVTSTQKEAIASVGRAPRPTFPYSPNANKVCCIGDVQ
ncbi:DUF2188 domain-containing protein [Legionella bozemanae]|uniref:DUF2188 domain-containing protein n=1 Tax=Legionella bozemanae TaxID=447 RepID=UPI00399CA514